MLTNLLERSGAFPRTSSRLAVSGALFQDALVTLALMLTSFLQSIWLRPSGKPTQ